MTPKAEQTLERLKSMLRPASIAMVGGFRPPSDPISSCFLQGVGHPSEGLPVWKDKPMFPLLQIRSDELPVVPSQFGDIALLVLFHNMIEHPFDMPHGQGWLIREYRNLEGLVPLPRVDTPFTRVPVRWEEVTDDAPGWEDAWENMDLADVNRDKAARDFFFQGFSRYDGTKVGGFPTEIQHSVGSADFVFQVGSEEKVGWMWGDNGIGYFHRSPEGEWRFSCQFL